MNCEGTRSPGLAQCNRARLTLVETVWNWSIDMGKFIDIEASDKGKFRAYVALPEDGAGTSPRAGIVLCQEIFGINEFIRSVADAFARDGFTVLAPDLFWRLEPGIELGYSDADWAKAFEYFQKFDTARAMDDVTASVRHLRTAFDLPGGIGALGYCLGGRLAYLAAADAGVDCAVGYYGVTIDQYLDAAERIDVPLMLHFAADDHYAPPEALAKITQAFSDRPNVTIHVYPGVDHAFARPASAHFDEATAVLARRRTLHHFRTALGIASGAS